MGCEEVWGEEGEVMELWWGCDVTLNCKTHNMRSTPHISTAPDHSPEFCRCLQIRLDSFFYAPAHS